MNIVIRADASTRIGTGHVMRCLALADQLRENGANITFLSRPHDGHLCDLIASKGYVIHQLPFGNAADDEANLTHAAWLGANQYQDAEACKSYIPPDTDWLIVDHYALDVRWESTLRGCVRHIMAIDDLADRRHDCDALVDQNLQQAFNRYEALTPALCKKFVGPRYALLRREFADARSQLPQVRSMDRQRVLACVGGTDPKDILSKVLAAWKLMPAPRPTLDIAVGANSSNVSKLMKACQDLHGVTLHVQAPNMAELMAQSDLLVCAAGSISWERCCVGLPAIMGVTADNQRLNLYILTTLRTGISVGDWNELEAEHLAKLMQSLREHPSLLARMGARTKRIVDGRGAERIAAFMLREGLFLKRAIASDATLSWPWRNAESTRRYFYNSQPVAFENHLAWWNAAISDPGRSLLIAMVGKMPVGVLRLDREFEKATVSVYLDPAMTGLGLGANVLLAGISWSRAHLPEVKTLVAEILPYNTASISAFQAAGFVKQTDNWTYEV